MGLELAVLQVEVLLSIVCFTDCAALKIIEAHTECPFGRQESPFMLCASMSSIYL